MIRKILILAANPKKTSPLRLDQEMREIDESLRRSRNREQFSLEKRLAVRTEDLRRSLLDEEPHFVHFCGHGTGDNGLVVENVVGEPQLIKAEALASLFKLFSSQIDCVILNACYSEVQAQAISQHIKYVVGMKQAIGDRAAIQFATGFYDAIGAGRGIEDAFEFGKNAIELQGIPEELTPVIKKNGTSKAEFDYESEIQDIQQSHLITNNSCDREYKLITLEIAELNEFEVRVSANFPYGSAGVEYPSSAMQDIYFTPIYDESRRLAEKSIIDLFLGSQSQTSFGYSLYSMLCPSGTKHVRPNGASFTASIRYSYDSVIRKIHSELLSNQFVRIQLKILQNDKRLFKVPWEFLFQGDDLGFLGASNDIALSRIINSNSKKSLTPLQFPMKMLLILSEPPSIGNLGCEEESELLRKVIRSYEQRGVVSVQTLRNPSMHELKQEIYKNCYHFVHYSGLDAKLFTKMSNQGMDTEGIVLLNDAKTHPKVIDFKELAEVFGNQNTVRLFVLNTCYTSEVLAPALVGAGVPSVVSMQYPIGVEAGKLFPKYFYSHLFADKFVVDLALSKTRLDFYEDNKRFGKNKLD